MFILSVILVLISTLILATMPITIDSLIKGKEKELEKATQSQNQAISDVKSSNYTGQGFSILQNQLKILQEINPKSSNTVSFFQELVSSKIQNANTTLNIVQLTGLLTQKEYNDYNSRINAPFDLSKFNESFEKLHTIHQELIKKVESGLWSLDSERKIKEQNLIKTKRIKAIMILIAVLFNSCSILIGTYITIVEKNKSKIELEIKNLKNDINSEFQNSNTKFNELKDSLNTLSNKLNSVIPEKERNGITKRKK